MDLVNLALVQKAVRDAHVDHIGPPGPKGDKGDKGDPLTWDDLTEEQKASLKGADGKSAYQYAVDGGYTGTKAEFAAKLAAEIPQADWNQNDSTAADYVKNRPFYTGDPVETELFDVCALADEAGYQWEDGDAALVVGLVADQLIYIDIPLVIGDKYIIQYNGGTYESTAIDGAIVGMDDMTIIGDNYYDLVTGSFNYGVLIVVEPYSLVDSSDTSGRYCLFMAADYNKVIPTELKVIKKDQEIVKIEEKFIPDELKGNFALSVNGITVDESRNINITPSDIGASKTIIITETGGTTDISKAEALNFLDMGYSVILKSNSKSGKLFTLTEVDRMSGLYFANVEVPTGFYGFTLIEAYLSGNSVRFNTFDYQSNYIRLKSSTENSVKYFNITVDDSGAISATEVT